MKFKFRGKTYDFVRKSNIKLEKQPLDGFCDHPQTPAKRILVDKNLEGEEELETIIHEFLHSCFWDISEEAVNEAGADIAKALWKLGYRKVE